MNNLRIGRLGLIILASVIGLAISIFPFFWFLTLPGMIFAGIVRTIFDSLGIYIFPQHSADSIGENLIFLIAYIGNAFIYGLVAAVYLRYRDKPSKS